MECSGWMGGWVDGWMDGWMEVKAGLRIAYSNQKPFTWVKYSECLKSERSDFRQCQNLN